MHLNREADNVEAVGRQRREIGKLLKVRIDDLATGAVARGTVEEDKSLVAVLNARGGQGGTVNAIVCPSGLRSSATTCRSAIDPAGAGLALLAVTP